MHLTAEELVQAYLDGPFTLIEHDEENRAHMHIFHEGCHECLESLLLLREVILSAGIPV